MITPLEGQRAAGVLLFGPAHQVACVTDLGFDLLFAVPIVVVRNQGHDDAVAIPAGQLERGPAVVQFGRVTPAHVVGTLPLRRLALVRQSQFLFRQLCQMRSQDHATGVPRPSLGIQSGIIAGNQWITGVPKNGLHKIEVADQRARNEETRFHGLGVAIAGDGRANQRSQQQRYPRSRGMFRFAGVG